MNTLMQPHQGLGVKRLICEHLTQCKQSNCTRKRFKEQALKKAYPSLQLADLEPRRSSIAASVTTAACSDCTMLPILH